jgi:TPR repeat protein
MSYNFIGLGLMAFKQRQPQALHWFSQALKTIHNLGAASETLLAGCHVQQGQAERAASRRWRVWRNSTLHTIATSVSY